MSNSGCQGVFNSRIPVWRFLSLVRPLLLTSPCRARGAGKPLPGQRSKRWDACRGFPSLAFPFGERDYLWPSLDMHHLLALWPLLLLASLVACKVWSLDLYLKKLPCITVYMLLQNPIKHPCSIRAWVPVSLSFSLSFWLIPWSTKAGCVTRGILPSSLLSLSHHRLRTTRFWSIKEPQQVAPRTGPGHVADSDRVTPGPIEADKY